MAHKANLVVPRPTVAPEQAEISLVLGLRRMISTNQHRPFGIVRRRFPSGESIPPPRHPVRPLRELVWYWAPGMFGSSVPIPGRTLPSYGDESGSS